MNKKFPGRWSLVTGRGHITETPGRDFSLVQKASTISDGSCVAWRNLCRSNTALGVGSCSRSREFSVPGRILFRDRRVRGG